MRAKGCVPVPTLALHRLPEIGFPEIRPVSSSIERALLAGGLRSRCILIISDPIDTALVLRDALVRAWLDPDAILGSHVVGDSRDACVSLVEFDASIDLAELQWRMLEYAARQRVWCLLAEDIEHMARARVEWLEEHALDGELLPGGLIVMVARELDCVPHEIRNRAVTFASAVDASIAGPYVMCSKEAEQESDRDIWGGYGCDPLGERRVEADAATSIAITDLRRLLGEHVREYGRGVALPGVHRFGGRTALPRSACARANGYASLLTLQEEQIEILPEPGMEGLFTLGRYVRAHLRVEAGLEYWCGVQPVGRALSMRPL
jgi:hypothetical protein